MSAQSLARKLEQMAEQAIVPNTTSTLELNVPVTVDRAASFGNDVTEGTYNQALKATLSPAAGSANVCLTTITVTTGAGTAMTNAQPIIVWLSDATTGIGLTATTASGAVAAGATGTDLSALVSKKAMLALTGAAGVYILSITDTAKTAFKVCVYIPGGGFFTTTLATANYG